ncbi:hypothetical protein SAMN05443428_11942 [Caloramator quimbayensis]|uniref:DUF6305 domain-containing protein n=1 Tax=Caloramator quimbayensis TaxID=1147123 RepID=A0A1T4Y2G3_9CLOT|nr:DUF6305 family protein [Caloramator quimbayensis]SKA95813.1 hypothetical protein SAMN05443428_11942 [Caloramator quimbayensis]
MKRKNYVIYFIVFFAILIIISEYGKLHKNQSYINVLLLPSLPQPIAKEYALITSAGQSSDVYIICDAANKLAIHNYFMPKATEEDLEGINTVVFAVGYSSIGEKMHDMSYDEEKKRIIGILKKAKEENKKVITIMLGGYERRNNKTDELLEILCSNTDYLIANKQADKDKYISNLAKDNKIPLTLINKVNDILEPFSSAFK